MERTNTFMKVWFFSRDAIPPELALTAEGVSPSVLARDMHKWGLPIAYYDLRPNSCSGQALGELRMVIEIDQCGPYAGNGNSNMDLELHSTSPSFAWNPNSLGGLTDRPLPAAHAAAQLAA